MCVRPRAPPPDSTRPIFGRFAGARPRRRCSWHRGGFAAGSVLRGGRYEQRASGERERDAASRRAMLRYDGSTSIAQALAEGALPPAAERFDWCGGARRGRGMNMADSPIIPAAVSTDGGPYRGASVHANGRSHAGLYRPMSVTHASRSRLHWLARAADLRGFALGLWMVDQPHCAVRRCASTPITSGSASPCSCWRSSGSRGVARTRRRRFRRRCRRGSARGARHACASLRADAGDSAVGLALQLGHRRPGRLPRPLPLPNLVPKDKALAAILKAVHQTLNFTLLRAGPCSCGAALQAPFRRPRRRACPDAAVRLAPARQPVSVS